MLDVKTLFVAMFAAFLIFGLTLAVSRRSFEDQPELAVWAWGAWAMVLAFVALSLRLVLPEWISIVGGNTLMFLGIYLQSDALHRFVTGLRAPRWQAVLAITGAVAITAMQGHPTSQRTALVSSVLALQGVPMLWVVLSKAWHAESSLRTVAIAIGIGLASLVARAIFAMVSPSEYDNFWQPSLGNGITYLAGYLFPLGAGIGFVMANLERSASRLREQATYDALTGCVRRGVFTTILAQTCKRAQREGEPLSLLVLDIDNFKTVNDTHGHQAGDHVLAAVAQSVRARLRHSDVFARMGGEEFAVILPNTDAAGAARVAESVRATIEALGVGVTGGKVLNVTVSGGIASLTADDARDGSGMYQRADAALYTAKHGGRNQIGAHPSTDGCRPA
ncbi:MAG: hypothetical protein JWP52_3416 [Rhizobacter sp.]|nr:hypothetical protein [Rhizobacter sp.]